MEIGLVLPPLAAPLACARCQRPLEPDKRYFRTCYECGHEHGRGLEEVFAATYAAEGTPAWDLVLAAKFERHEPEIVAEAVLGVTAALWAAIERHAGEFLNGDESHVAVLMPSEWSLLERCVAEAGRRDYPGLRLIPDALIEQDRPKQTGLSQPERRAAAVGKYSCVAGLRGRHVLLLDDVYTTGSSMHDAARAALAAGAESAVGIVYARRVYPDAMAIYREARGG